MTKKRSFRMVAFLLCMVLMISLIPGMAFAQSEGEAIGNDDCPEGWIDLGGGVWISEEMSFEELVKFHANENDMSMEEARRELRNLAHKKSENLLHAASSTPSRVLSVSLDVTSSYKPKLQFYVYTSNWSTYWLIESIYYITLHREYNGISKQFSGDIAVWNRGNNRIEYDINGDFYNNGTTTGGVGVDIEIGENATAKFSVSNSSNHYKYYHSHATKVYSGK